MTMEAKLCNLLFFSQRPRKASGVVQRLECQRVHSVECSPVWRPENQDCRGSRGQTSYTQRAGGRCQTSYTQGPTVGARPRTRRGPMVGARPPTCRRSGCLTSLPFLFCSGLTGLDDAHRHWRAFCFTESSNSHAGLFLRPPWTQPKIMFNQLVMRLLASLIKLTCKIKHHSHITKYSAFFP